MDKKRLNAIKERFSRVTFMLGRSNSKTQLIRDINDLIASAEENERLREALTYIANFEIYDGKDRYYYQNLIHLANLKAKRTLGRID